MKTLRLLLALVAFGTVVQAQRIPRTVPTVTDMLALDPRSLATQTVGTNATWNGTVITLGDTTAGTPGSRIWRWNTTSTATTNTIANGGPVAAPWGASSGRWFHNPPVGSSANVSLSANGVTGELASFTGTNTLGTSGITVTNVQNVYRVVLTAAQLVAQPPADFASSPPGTNTTFLALVTTTGDAAAGAGKRDWRWDSTSTATTNTAIAGGPIAYPYGASTGRWVEVNLADYPLPDTRLMVIPSLYPDPIGGGVNAGNPTTHFQSYITNASNLYDPVLGKVRLQFPSGTYSCDELVWYGHVHYDAPYTWRCRMRTGWSGGTSTVNRSIMRTQRYSIMNVDATDGAFLSWVTSPVDYSNPDNCYGLSDDVEVSGKFIFDQAEKNVALPLCRLNEIRDWIVHDGAWEVWHGTNTLTNSWAIAIGGRNVNWFHPIVRNGKAITQDGVHLMYGDRIRIISGDLESGDDAIALEMEAAGGSTAPPDEALNNVIISGVTVAARKARAVGIFGGVNQINVPYVNGLRIRNVTVNGITGDCSKERQSAFYFGSYQAADGIWEYTITSPGSGYTDGYYVLSMTSTGGGSGAQVHVKVVGGQVVRAVMAKVSGSFRFGSGYTQDQTAVITGMGTGTGAVVTGKVFGLPNDRVERITLSGFDLNAGGTTHDNTEAYLFNIRGANDVTIGPGSIRVIENATNALHRPFSILSCSNVVFSHVTFGTTTRGGSINSGNFANSSVNMLTFDNCLFRGHNTAGNGVLKFNGTNTGTVLVQDCTFERLQNSRAVFYMPDTESSQTHYTGQLEVQRCHFFAASASPSSVMALDFVNAGSAGQMGKLIFRDNDMSGITLYDTAAVFQAAVQKYVITGNHGGARTQIAKKVTFPSGSTSFAVTVDTYTGLIDATGTGLARVRVTPLADPGSRWWIEPNTTTSFNIRMQTAPGSNVDFAVVLDTSTKPQDTY